MAATGKEIPEDAGELSEDAGKLPDGAVDGASVRLDVPVAGNARYGQYAGDPCRCEDKKVILFERGGRLRRLAVCLDARL